MKKIVAVIFGFLFISLCPSSAFAQSEIAIRGSGRLVPVALPRFCRQGDSNTADTEIPETIGRDLDLSGYFQILNSASYIESPGKCGGPEDLAYTDWSVIGAEGLVRGVVEGEGSNLKIKMYLHDVSRRQIVFGKEYEADRSQVSTVAHRFANEVMKFFTGIHGVFGTKIAFSSRIGRFKELFVMDMDGSNIRQLTNDRGLAVSAAWNPRADSLLYTSYRDRVPNIFSVDINRRRISQVTKSRALEIPGSYSQDGSVIVASVTEGKESDIVLLDKNGSVLRKLTDRDGAIDVSPDWSPDNRKIVFCSNRSGGPQIYTMDMHGKGVRRISFAQSTYCTSPSWSPTGERVAFVCRADRGHQIFVANPDGSDAQQLTSAGSNEDPSWSPDGRYIVFSSTLGSGSRFHLAMMRYDGSNLRQLTNGRTDDTQPSWGPVLPG